jgi:hypothetical protein
VAHIGRKVAAAGLLGTSIIPFRAGPVDAFCLVGLGPWKSDANPSALNLGVRPTVPSGHFDSVGAAGNGFNGVTNGLEVENIIYNDDYGDRRFRLVYSNTTALGLSDSPGVVVNSTTYGGDATQASHSYSIARYNSSWTWNESGDFDQANQEADVRTVVLHEFGHSHGLAHPSVCGNPYTSAEMEAVMTPDFTKKWTIRSDDSSGIDARY